jgi:hypothetical protein
VLDNKAISDVEAPEQMWSAGCTMTKMSRLKAVVAEALCKQPTWVVISKLC